MAIGLDVKDTSEDGFKTLLTCYFLEKDLTDSEVIDLMAKCSVHLNTDVATGNFIDAKQICNELYLVVTPTGQVYRVDEDKRNGVIEFDPIGKQISLAELISHLAQKDKEDYWWKSTPEE